MKNLWVAFIESNTSGTGRLFARSAAECGYRPVVIAERPDRYQYIRQDSLDHVACDTGSMGSLCKALEELARETPPSGICSSSEYFLETAAILAERYGLPGADPEALRSCRNKWIQRQRLRDAGFLTPKFERVTSLDEACAAFKTIPPPVVLKPVLGSGSVGVRLCRTREEALTHAGTLLRRTANERGQPVASELLVEEYLAGPEFSVEVFGGSVLGITRKYLSPEPFFVELGHDFPAGLPAPEVEKTTEMALLALNALGLMWGPMHIELRMTARGPAIVEINPRLAGGFIPEIIRLALGVDVVRETIRLVVGQQPELHPRFQRHASIRFLVPPGNGTITEISGLTDALAIEGVADVQAYRKPGDHVEIENDFRDRIGHAIACRDLEIDAAQAAAWACGRIRVHIEAG